MRWLRGLAWLVTETHLEEFGFITVAIGLVYALLSFSVVVLALFLERSHGFHIWDVVLRPVIVFVVACLYLSASYCLALTMVGVLFLLVKLCSLVRQRGAC